MAAEAPLRVEALEEELSSAINREWERKAVDEMKKRAIVSATSYDEFKNLVACATQKPLSREDFAKKPDLLSNKAVKPSSGSGSGGGSKLGGLEALLGGRGAFTLDESAEAAASSAGALRKLSRAAHASSSSSSTGSGGGGAATSSSAASSSSISASVRTPGDFDREWRRARRVGMAKADATPEEEMFYAFLRAIGDVPRVAGVFKGEMDGDVLARLARTAAWAAEQAAVGSGAGSTDASSSSSSRSGGLDGPALLSATGAPTAGSDGSGAEGSGTAGGPTAAATPVQYMLQLLLEVSRSAAGFGLAWDLLAPQEQASFRRAVLPAAAAAFGDNHAAVAEFNGAFA